MTLKKIKETREAEDKVLHFTCGLGGSGMLPVNAAENRCKGER